MSASLADLWPPRDRLGRVNPHRFALPSWVKAVPGFSEQFKKVVPDQSWNQDVDEDGTAIGVIACTCGRTPEVRLASTAECDCGRVFAHFGREIRVYRPEESDPSGS